jgi:precorrin-8X/cobalt-precorrin-8 methylmutase
LYRLLDMLAETSARPAYIVGMPLGFVGAAESKEALIADAFSTPFITIRGRKGGSAIAAAALNAIASDAE